MALIAHKYCNLNYVSCIGEQMKNEELVDRDAYEEEEGEWGVISQ